MKIDIYQNGEQLTLKLQGKLCGAWVATLEDCWRDASMHQPNRKFSVDLTDVTLIDAAGWYLLQLMHRDGVNFATTGLMTQELAERIAHKNR